MKCFETTYEEYVANVMGENLHPYLTSLFNHFPNTMNDLKNIILFGPQGTGKYSQCLYSISKYSPSNLKYEKKANIIFNKEPYYFKISDIHYEVDMSLLGCNSKQLWFDINSLIIDIITTKQNKCGIIICKNFHKIHNELLDNFYSFMQTNYNSCIDIKYILLTEELGFINDNIINCCEVIHLSRPSKTLYNKIISYNNKLSLKDNHKSKVHTETKTTCIENIKLINGSNNQIYSNTCDKIIYQMKNYNQIQLMTFRELMYELLVFDLNIYKCVWYIIENFSCEINIQTNQYYINKNNITAILTKTFEFLKYFNNNYRPIFHLENYFLFVTEEINNLR